jgi:16S rRNA (uracil1498-N3)-methyltransferase
MTEWSSPPTEPLFYCPAMNADGDLVLADDEAHHVAVQRLQPGDEIALFDGLGHVARGAIRTLGRTEVRVEVTERYREPNPVPRLDLYCAIPKGDRVAVLLDMATQLGMGRFTPLRLRRGVVQPGERAQERWQRICLEACKQSRRVYLPEVAAPLTVEEAADKVNASGDRLIVAHPSADSKPISTTNLSGALGVALFVGPEGGWTDEELEMLRRRDAYFVHLGASILRIETAAVALLCAVNALCASSAVPGTMDCHSGEPRR